LALDALAPSVNGEVQCPTADRGAERPNPKRQIRPLPLSTCLNQRLRGQTARRHRPAPSRCRRRMRRSQANESGQARRQPTRSTPRDRLAIVCGHMYRRAGKGPAADRVCRSDVRHTAQEVRASLDVNRPSDRGTAARYCNSPMLPVPTASSGQLQGRSRRSAASEIDESLAHLRHASGTTWLACRRSHAGRSGGVDQTSKGPEFAC